MTRREEQAAAAPIVCMYCGGNCAEHLATFVRRLVARIEPWSDAGRSRLCARSTPRGPR